MSKKIVILGGGISGLSLLWFLKQKLRGQADILLFEKKDRVGGWIQTIRKGGFSFEQGPQFMTTKDGEVVFKLIQDLGLEKMIVGNEKKAVKRYLYLGGKLHVLPKTIFQLLFSPLAKGFLPGLIHEWREPVGQLEDESIDGFIRRRFNPELADGLISYFIRAFTLGDFKKLSMKSTLPSIWNLEKKQGGVIRGMFAKKDQRSDKSAFQKEMEQRFIFEFKEGLEMLPQTLGKNLNDQINLLTPAKELRLSHNKVQVVLQGQQIIEADHVFSAISADELADLLPPQNHEAASLLRTFSYNSLAVVNFGFNKQLLKNENERFGLTVADQEKQPFLGAIWSSSLFPQLFENSAASLNIMIGENHLPKPFDQMQEGDFYAIALQGLKKFLNIHHIPDASTVKIIKNGTSKFEVGHAEKVEKLKQLLAETTAALTFLGSSYSEGSIVALIKNAKKIAEGFSLEDSTASRGCLQSSIG